MSKASAERGAASLAEILVAIAIVGIAFSGILAGLGGAILGSRLHRDRSEAQLVLSSAADAVRSTSVSHVACATTTTPTYLNAIRSVAVPTGWNAASSINLIAVRYWSGSGFTATCYDTDDLGHLLKLQLLTVQVAAPDGQITESIVVVKE